MEENYAEGDLGLIFNNATPLTLPIVAQLLHARRDSADDSEATRALVQNCREQVDMLQETSASELVVRNLRHRRLRLRQDGGNALNAHLAHLVIDADGNATLATADEGEDGPGGSAGPKPERMKAFEVVALTTLMPKSVEEALVLVPSLVRFEAADLQEVVMELEQ